jgi:hypothetical protein
MVDEIKLVRQRARGQEAKRLWENSMLQEFFEAVEKQIKDALFDSKADEGDVRERCYLMMRLHENYKQQFKSFMFTGEIASKQLLDIEEMKRGRRHSAG